QPRDWKVSSSSLMTSNMSDGVAKVCAEIERRCKTMNAGELTGLTRSALGAWVEREERVTGSRMAAYERVAQSVGRSPSWIRSFLAQSERAKQPDWTVGWNILNAYGRIVERIEREAAAEVSRAKTLRE